MICWHPIAVNINAHIAYDIACDIACDIGEHFKHSGKGSSKRLRCLLWNKIFLDWFEIFYYKIYYKYEVYRRLARHSPRAEANNTIQYSTMQYHLKVTNIPNNTMKCPEYHTIPR